MSAGRCCGIAVSAGLALAASSAAQVYEENLPVDHPAVQYWGEPLENPVARLEHQKVALDFHEGGLSYLPSLLEQLNVSPDSQTLVFTKTSLQRNDISPRSPRAIYFGDDVAIGFVPGGDVIEVAAVEPGLGVVFYTLSTRKTEKPSFRRPKVCLECHQGPATLGIPGVYVGSVSASPSGRPNYLGSIVTDHRTPFEDRWGGWFVKGTHVDVSHKGNAVASGPAGKNRTALVPNFDASRYPSLSSDIVALMTLEHQTHVTNLLTRLTWEARVGSGSTTVSARIEELVRYMLFADEVPLPGPIRGVSTFAETFPRRGPRDRKGRSLRDFDLDTRLFRYPLSYMIYSEAFDALPDDMRERVCRRLNEVLTGSELENHSRHDRKAILEILRETSTCVAR